ncbi:hypothetical protein F5Y12DRAFT_795784 [Xylaria sp. FL1777]|nr:hypothetical protein F5Y12DRAFT_795784 [Xylaria sp. FL1777]
MAPNTNDKMAASLSQVDAQNASSAQTGTIDSAVSMTFSENVEYELASFEGSIHEPEMDAASNSGASASSTYESDAIDNSVSPSVEEPATADTSVNPPVALPPAVDHSNDYILINGMPYTFQRITDMGDALARARRERMFPNTITPGYNALAIVDDYEDLQRLNAVRENVPDARDNAFHPEVSSLYIQIQRRIQDRDLTHGEVAADANVRARLGGFANGTAAEAGMYNLMRHALNSVLRLNNLTIDSDNNLVESAAARVISEIRNDVQARVARGEHNIEGVDMNGVMEDVFNAIEHALGDRVESQANRLDANATRAENITNAQNIQLDAIVGHTNAINNHVQAMGNNVNAMGVLLNSTNGNVTSLTANIAVLQTIVNMIPRMVADAVREMLPAVLPDILPGILGPAIEAAITNELLNHIQALFNPVDQAPAQAPAQEGAAGPRNHRRRNEGRSWYGRLNIFKQRFGRRGRRSNNDS